jgi:hypothetical protein
MIRLGDRVIAVGKTGEGKSEALLYLFAQHTGPRILIDGADHYTLGPDAIAEGALEATRPGELDWSHRTIRYVPHRPGDLREMEELYHAIYARGGVLVLADEVEDVAPVGRTPAAVRRVVKQGRKRKITHLAATQRPFGVDPAVLSESEHALIFRLVRQQDVAAIAPRLGLETDELFTTLRELPKHGHLYHTIEEADVIRRLPPMPASYLELTRRHIRNPG